MNDMPNVIYAKGLQTESGVHVSNHLGSPEDGIPYIRIPEGVAVKPYADQLKIAGRAIANQQDRIADLERDLSDLLAAVEADTSKDGWHQRLVDAAIRIRAERKNDE